jgi:ABC-2 type transport system permease protein
MKKTLIVMRREFLNVVAKPSFWFGIFVMPIIMGVVVGFILITTVAATAATAASRRNETQLQGIVDESSILSRQTSLVTPEKFRLFQTETEAQTALASKQIGAYFFIDKRFVENRKVRYVSTQFSPIDWGTKTDEFEKLLRLALFNGDENKLARFDNPVIFENAARLAPPDQKDIGGEFSPLPIAAALMIMIPLIGASSYLMQTVSTEKENRVIEVLMFSISPTQLLTGKMLGLSLIGFIQFVLWLGSGLSALNVLRRLPYVSQLLSAIDPVAVAWLVVYAVIGYFIYASAMAGLGALMPGTKESTQFTFFIILPLLIPIYFNTSITAQPNGMLATILSLIPFCAPVAMPMRLFATEVSPWQPTLAAVLMVLAAIFMVKLAAKLFRAQTLLSGTKPNLKQIAAALR